MSKLGTGIDIVHLTETPPYAPGSVNRIVGAQMRKLRQFRQIAVSFASPNSPPDREGYGENVILVDGHGLSLRQRLMLLLPYRCRTAAYRVGGRQGLTYLWQVRKLLPVLRPKLVVCYDGPKWTHGLRAVQKWPMRLILSQHGLSYHLPPAETSDLYSLKSFDAVWLLTQASYRFDRLRSERYEVPVEILPVGVDLGRFFPAPPDLRIACRRRWDIPDDAQVVLTVSRLVPKKGVHLLVESWLRVLNRVPNAFLWIVGGGDLSYYGQIRSHIHALGLESSVRLQGKVPPDAISSCYEASDLCVFPTLCTEGLMLTLVEALACGVPAICSDSPSLRETFTEAEVRFVEDPNLDGQFVAPIVHLLQSPEERQTLAECGLAAVRQRCDEQIGMSRLTEFYERQLMLVDH